jgi:hypothetical protein
VLADVVDDLAQSEIEIAAVEDAHGFKLTSLAFKRYVVLLSDNHAAARIQCR